MRSLLILMALSAPQAPEAEVRVVEYLKTHVKPGEHIVVSPRGAQPQHRARARAPALRQGARAHHLGMGGAAGAGLRGDALRRHAPGFGRPRRPAAPRLLLVHERLAYAKQQGLGFTLAHMTAETQEAFGAVSVFPTMFFVDAKGTIVKHFLNQQDKASLEAAVRLALQ
jgi:hypothetical protein